MFELEPETRDKLRGVFSRMVRELVTENDPDGFAVAAAMGIVVFSEACEVLARVGAALVGQIEAHRVSVEDLIGALQETADAASARKEGDVDPDPDA